MPQQASQTAPDPASAGGPATMTPTPTTPTVRPTTRRRPAPILTGAELRAIRQRLGLTQAELARRLGYTRSAIWRWERLANPTDDTDGADGSGAPCAVASIPLAQVARLLDELQRERAAQEAHRALYASLCLPAAGDGG